MSVQTIIQESVNKNPLKMKQAVEEELRSRIIFALEAKDSDSDHDLWHIEAEHISDANKIGKIHPEAEYLGKDDTFSSIHHFFVHGSKKQVEKVRNTVWKHNGGASAILKPYHEE